MKRHVIPYSLAPLLMFHLARVPTHLVAQQVHQAHEIYCRVVLILIYRQILRSSFALQVRIPLCIFFHNLIDALYFFFLDKSTVIAICDSQTKFN